MRAIVLVGGEGTRLQPLTLCTLKQFVPILNRSLLEHLLLHLRSHGVLDITLAMTRHSQRVEEVFGDGASLGMRIKYVYEEIPLGSGGAIACAAAEWTEPFLVCNGDLLTSLDVTAFIAAHQAKEAVLSISLHEVEDPSPFGVVVLGEGDRIVRFVETPPRETAPSLMINAGTWLFDPALLDEMDGTQFNRVEDVLFPSIANAGRPMYGFMHRGFWLDVGNPDVYLYANLALLQGEYPERLPAGWPANGLATAEARVDAGAQLDAPVLLGAGTVVEADATVRGPVVIGSGCVIGAGATVTRSVLWDNVTVEAGASVSDSILANGAHIGAGARVDGAVFGQGASVGAGSVVPPGTRVAPDTQWLPK